MILYDGSAPEWSSLAAGARVRSLAERYPCLRSGVFGRSGTEDTSRGFAVEPHGGRFVEPL